MENNTILDIAELSQSERDSMVCNSKLEIVASFVMERPCDFDRRGGLAYKNRTIHIVLYNNNLYDIADDIFERDMIRRENYWWFWFQSSLGIYRDENKARTYANKKTAETFGDINSSWNYKLSKIIEGLDKPKPVNLDDLLQFLLHYPNLMYNTPTYKEIRKKISDSDIEIILKGGARRLYTATCSKPLEWHEEEYKRCFSIESMSGF